MEAFEISIRRERAEDIQTPLLVLLHIEGDADLASSAAAVDRRIGGQASQALRSGDFKGSKDESLLLFPRSGEIGADRVLLVGLGKREEFGVGSLRRATGTAIRTAERVGVGSLAVSLDPADELVEDLSTAAQGTAEGAVLAAWEFTEFKAPKEDKKVRPSSLAILARSDDQVALLERGARWGRIVASGENLARTLASRPSNVATPTHLAEIAKEIADRHGLDLTVLDGDGIREERMGGLLAVSQGTEQEPRFIALEYKGAEMEGGPLVLVGKGITFDTGGVSIKPAAGMEDMKYDMSGAAAVLGAMRAIAELGIQAHVVGLIPSTENMLSGRSIKPGDIIRSHLGKTVEVINTDAEGRLILMDALSYAHRYKPQAILDAATLTGACVIALGHHAVGLMGNDEALIEEVRAAGERTGERCWPLPLWGEYRRQLDSDFADLKNVGGRPAGTITAGWFLREFVGDIPWAHLDIAGTAYRTEPLPYLRKGATGIPTRLFVEWVRARAER